LAGWIEVGIAEVGPSVALPVDKVPIFEETR
jgi:hypothetical protein